MILDGLHQVGCAAVMQKEETLSQSPKRSGAELVGSGSALVDAIGERRAHVVQGEVRIWMIGDIRHSREWRCRSCEAGRVA